MRWSIQIGKFAGIKVYLHWTFLILLAWIFLAHLGAGYGVPMALQGVLFLLALFGCVLLHEFGHSLMAARYGIRTQDITLLPIGGLARLKRLPENPVQELWIALAGPAVNVAIAALLFAGLMLWRGLVPLSEIRIIGGSFVGQLMWVNVILVVFNMLPAFPMDGGRVLRALMARRLSYVQATRVAARIGQFLAVLMALAGLFVLQNPMLLIVAAFVFLGAEAESRMVQITSALRGMRVADAMVTRFKALLREDSLTDAIQELLAGTQQDFPVVDGQQVVGILTRQNLVRGLAENGRQASVSDVMTPNCPVVPFDEKLETSYDLLRQEGVATLPVVQEGRLVGLITQENILEWLMVRSALREAIPA